MNGYNFAEALVHWSAIPVDDFGYMEGKELMLLHDDQLRELIELASSYRWSQCMWRNFGGALEKFMELPRWIGKEVLDFGCGFGLDSIEFIKNGAFTYLADLHPWTLAIAQKSVILATGRLPVRLCPISYFWPYFFTPKLDLFWSFGVLHHIPYAKDILNRAVNHLNPNGECRIVVYSDIRWKEMMGEEPPKSPIENHPKFMEFVRKNDPVGMYADWYDKEKIVRMVDGFAQVTEVQYLCNNQFLGAVIKPL